MKTSSAKAKGRRLQKVVRDYLRMLGQSRGLVEADVESRGMGQAGEDVILSPAARKLFDLYVECKNVEKLNVIGTFEEHYQKYQDKPGLKLLVHSRNNTKPLVTIRLDDFIKLLGKGLD